MCVGVRKRIIDKRIEKEQEKGKKINANSLIFECINLDKNEVLYNGKMV